MARRIWTRFGRAKLVSWQATWQHQNDFKLDVGTQLEAINQWLIFLKGLPVLRQRSSAVVVLPQIDPGLNNGPCTDLRG